MNGNLFEVVAIDEEHNTVELQHFDGTIESLDFEVWWDIDIESAQAPDDWSGSVDIDVGELPDPEYQAVNGWQDPLLFLEPHD